MDDHLRQLQRRFLAGDTIAAGSLFIGEYRANLLSEGSVRVLATLGFEPARSVMPPSTLLIPRLGLTVCRQLPPEHCFQLAVIMLVEGFTTLQACYANEWLSTQELFPLILSILDSYQKYVYPDSEISELYTRFVSVSMSQRAWRTPAARRNRYLASLIDQLRELGYLLRGPGGAPEFNVLPNTGPSEKLLKSIVAIDNLVTCIRTDEQHAFALPHQTAPIIRIGRNHRLRLRKAAGIVIHFGFEYPREALEFQRRNLYQSLSLHYLRFLQTE